MISEHEFQREWKRLFSNREIQPGTVEAARDLLDRLPLTSPLRLRFGRELQDIEVILSRKAE